MNVSIWLLTTVLGAGEPMLFPSDVPMNTTAPQQAVYPAPQVMYAAPQPQQRRGLLDRLFHRGEDSGSTQGPVMGAVYQQPQAMPVTATVYENPRMMPMPMQLQPQMMMTSAEPPLDGPVLPAAAAQGGPAAGPEVTPAAAVQVATEVKKEFQKKVGHADDYAWITGQLFYVHADGGVWVLRYSSIGEEDRYGGSAVLAPVVNMKNYREGDLVSVTGEVLDQGRPSRHLGGCLYRASHIEMIDRAD